MLILEDDPVYLKIYLKILYSVGHFTGGQIQLGQSRRCMGSGYGCGIEFLAHCYLLRNHTEITNILGL